MFIFLKKSNYVDLLIAHLYSDCIVFSIRPLTSSSSIAPSIYCIIASTLSIVSSASQPVLFLFSYPCSLCHYNLSSRILYVYFQKVLINFIQINNFNNYLFKWSNIYYLGEILCELVRKIKMWRAKRKTNTIKKRTIFGYQILYL